jgi:murein DD-endopeptidase MepM/ murein hydrolase activator NlpD
MDDQLHIIVAGNRGKVFKLPFSYKKLCLVTTVSVVTLLILTVTSICSFSLYYRNCNIKNQLVSLQKKLHNNAELVTKTNRLSEDQWIKLNQKIARLELDNIKQANAFKQEKESLISTAVDELNERSELIERIIANIGIKIPQYKDRNAKHSGGPFIQQTDTGADELLYKADKYLNVIQCLPLGKPVSGSISSGFGKRKDPLNNKSAFHTGIDFRGNLGEPIYATADGVVKKAFRNGGYGNYVLIDHGNGFTSSFSHMQKYLVHKGDSVERGQLIGLIGNTGRSTGSHLHYEIARNNKVINPAKFLKVAGLTRVVLSSPQKKKLR